MEQPYPIPQSSDLFLHLDRPIVFFDLETTGKQPAADRIVELCGIKLFPDGSRKELHHLINPGMPIPPEATAIHGITDADVANKPMFADLLDELESFFAGCDLGGYNIRRFDVPFLMEEFYRCGRAPIKSSEVRMVDAMGIFHLKEKRDLSAAVQFYCGRAHEGAHSAKADVEATIDVLRGQLMRYNDLQPNPTFLHELLSDGAYVDFGRKFVRDASGVIRFGFGQHKGKVADTEPDYLKWMFEKGDFPADTRIQAQRIYYNRIWKTQVEAWLHAHAILETPSMAAALYTTLKFGQDVVPFRLGANDRGKTVLTMEIGTAQPFTFMHRDVQALMLQALDNLLAESAPEAVPSIS